MGSKVHTFGKKDRLKSALEISALFESGLRAQQFPFKIIYQHTKDFVGLKVAISVPKKKVKKAVTRNVIKRRIKEAYRTQKLFLQNQLVSAENGMRLLIIFHGSEPPSFSDTKAKIMLLLQRLAVEEKP